ncbi:MAG: type II 3-dehydroquinate dehydratase [Ignavibacteriaceae bacterium]
MKFLIINGPNLNQLGERNPSQYGTKSLEDIQSELVSEFPTDEFEFYHSNIEGEIVNKIISIQNNYDGLVINPGAYSHYSIAIHDALESCRIKKVEVHLSNLAKREDFRQTLLTAKNCDAYISGFKENVYIIAVFSLKKYYL